MRIAVHSVDVEFRMLARLLEIRSSPQAIATQGTTALVMAKIANDPSRVLQPSPRRGRPITLTITASARKPEAARSSSSTAGLMSCTATLIKRNETPQIRASPASARYGLKLDTPGPLIRGEHDRDGA